MDLKRHWEQEKENPVPVPDRGSSTDSVGGIIGVAVGIALAYIISGVSAVPVAISGTAIVVAVLFSTLIGVIFGLIPSVKAANMNPIDALRYE